MLKLVSIFSLFTELVFISCKLTQVKNAEVNNNTLIIDAIVFETENLKINKLSNHIYEHISFLNTDDYGKVACNGMFVVNENVGVLFDTSIDNRSSFE